MTEVVTKTEMRTVKKELDRMELEIIRLKAALLPTEKLSKKDRVMIDKAKKSIAKGHWVSLDKLTKEFG
jgi:hypothetical protein